MYPFLSKALIGLDIQPHAMRLIQLRQSGRRFLAINMAEWKWAEPVFAAGKTNDFFVIQAVLSEWVNTMEQQGALAAIHIPIKLVRVHTIQLPIGVSHLEIEMEIHLQMERDIPGMHHSLAIDYRVKKANVSGYCDIHYVATREDYIKEYVQCMNATGLSVKIVDVDEYALKRLDKRDPFPLIRFRDGLLQQAKAYHLPDFLLAISLAMREAPRW